MIRKLLKIFIFLSGITFLIFFLNLVFSGRLILTQTFSLGFLRIHYYGIIMAVSVLSGYFYALWSAEKFGFSRKQTEDLAVWIIPVCFIGARLWHVAGEWGYYQKHLLEIFQVWQGGLGIFGVVFAGAFGLVALKKFLRLNSSVLNIFDWLAPAVLAGQILGRFGNLFNYEAYGYPTDLPWKMFVPDSFRPVEYAGVDFFHPWFLYESLGNLILFGLIFLYVRRKKTALEGRKIDKNLPEGSLFFSYILWYNLLRFSLEFLRIDSTIAGGIRINGAVALLLALAGGAALIWVYKKPNQCLNTTI